MKKNKDGKLVSPLGIVQPFNADDAVKIGKIEGDLGVVDILTKQNNKKKK